MKSVYTTTDYCMVAKNTPVITPVIIKYSTVTDH